jgi:long-chain acyl-CoA synthetase
VGFKVGFKVGGFLLQPRTICDVFQSSVHDLPRQKAYLHKVGGAYRAVSSHEIVERVQSVAAALRAIGVQPGDRVAILSGNCIEWAIADYAILHCGGVTVPLYPTLKSSGVLQILKDCDATAAFVADAEQLQKIGSLQDLPHLQHAIVLQAAESTTTSAERTIYSMSEFENRGIAAYDAKAFERTWRAVKPDDLATLIYTSGTTGVPKGVMLTHDNIVSNMLAILLRVQPDHTDRCLSFLPLSHIFERMGGHFLMWYTGTTIAFAESIETVPTNLNEIRPTILVSVPRLYEKMNARVLASVEASSPTKQKLFAWARKVGGDRLALQQNNKAIPLWLQLQFLIADKLVFSKLRERLGGRIRFMISGGAPLSRPIAEFFHSAGLFILEGYGLTETSPVVSLNPLQRPRLGTVGPLLQGVEVNIADNGEILVRGRGVMKGYWQRPKETAAVLADGWFHTGDIGEINSEGYLRITDRLKDIIVTAAGKNIAPQPIESSLKASQFIAEAIVIGDQRKHLSVILVPHFLQLQEWAATQGIPAEPLEALVKHPKTVQLYCDVLARINQELPSFETLKRCCLLDRELQLESSEITPTMKVKRSVITKNYAALIECMYEDSPPTHIGCPGATATTEPPRQIAG